MLSVLGCTYGYLLLLFLCLGGRGGKLCKESAIWRKESWSKCNKEGLFVITNK